MALKKRKVFFMCKYILIYLFPMFIANLYYVTFRGFPLINVYCEFVLCDISWFIYFSCFFLGTLLRYILNDITFQITTAFSFKPKCHRGWKWPQFSGSFGWTCLTFAPITFHPSKVCLKSLSLAHFRIFHPKRIRTN